MAGAGNKIVSVHSRNFERAEHNASFVAAIPSDDLRIPSSADIILIMVSDDAIKEVVDKMKCNDNQIVAHVAGSIGLDVFNSPPDNKGVFYPLQTFTMGRTISLKEVPLFIDGGSEATRSVLTSLAESVSDRVTYANLEQRRMLHVAAVFASNFTNNMLHNSNIIMKRSDLDFKMLEPLVKETVMKAFDMGPGKAQTGPAFRDDRRTILMQKELLSFDPLLKEIYSSISDLIGNYSKNNKQTDG